MNNRSETGPHCFAMPAWISCSPFEQLLGMEIVRAKAGEAVLRLPFVRELAQGVGLMHGGALVSLADAAVVMAIKSMVAPGTHFVTIAMESRFLRPVERGVVTAKACVYEKRGDVLKGRCDIFDETGRSAMTFSCVFKITQNVQGREAGCSGGPASLPTKDP